MPARPIHTHGVLQKIDSSWHIVLDDAHPSFEDAMKAEVILWDSRSEGGRSEVEEIASMQQLEPAIVALALASEGSLADTDFAKKLTIS
jgi:hypothetical protein